jgi:hypothetical protein
MKKANNYILLVIIMLIVLKVSSYAGIGDGLYAHFQFEQSSNDSTMNLTGFEYGNGINYEKGVVGNYAGKFDGETVILFSNDYLFPLCNGTINFFVKIDPEAPYNVRIMDSKTNFRTWIGYNAENSELNGYLTVPIEKNQWYMFTFVYSNGCSSSGSRKAYLNGVLTSENVGYANNGNIGTWYTSACSYYSLIGLWLAADEKMASSQKFKGLLDDIRIYNRALSINEIQELYRMATFNLPSICSYNVSSSSGNFIPKGETKYITIQTSDENCTWTASESLDWVSVSPNNGIGSGNVTVSVTENNGATRFGTVTIADQAYSISQEAGILTNDHALTGTTKHETLAKLEKWS